MDTTSLPAQTRTDRYDRVVYCGGTGPWACSQPTVKTAYNKASPFDSAAAALLKTVEVQPAVRAAPQPVVDQVEAIVQPVVAPVAPPAPAPEPVVAQAERDVVFKNVLFAFNSNVPTREGREILEAYWEDLVGKRIELVGYTDNVGERAFNDELALYRAMTVRNYLMSKGLFETNIKIKGRGLCCYIASNKSHETRGLNRRVEIHVIGE